nr:MAG TPA: hypothetical protein [Bacteriophage sp.]
MYHDRTLIFLVSIILISSCFSYKHTICISILQ